MGISEPCAAPKIEGNGASRKSSLRAWTFAVRPATEITQKPKRPPQCRQTAGNLQNLHIFLHTFTAIESNVL
jgi:hypothetical protein